MRATLGSLLLLLTACVQLESQPSECVGEACEVEPRCPAQLALDELAACDESLGDSMEAIEAGGPYGLDSAEIPASAVVGAIDGGVVRLDTEAGAVRFRWPGELPVELAPGAAVEITTSPHGWTVLSSETIALGLLQQSGWNSMDVESPPPGAPSVSWTPHCSLGSGAALAAEIYWGGDLVLVLGPGGPLDLGTRVVTHHMAYSYPSSDECGGIAEGRFRSLLTAVWVPEAHSGLPACDSARVAAAEARLQGHFGWSGRNEPHWSSSATVSEVGVEEVAVEFAEGGTATFRWTDALHAAFASGETVTSARADGWDVLDGLAVRVEDSFFFDDRQTIHAPGDIPFTYVQLCAFPDPQGSGEAWLVGLRLDDGTILGPGESKRVGDAYLTNHTAVQYPSFSDGTTEGEAWFRSVVTTLHW